jgi:tetratricopeptide (TPR) repeat protein
MDEAIKKYKKALKINPNNVETRYKLGFALIRNGFFDEAIEERGEVIRIDPKDEGAHNNLRLALYFIRSSS